METNAEDLLGQSPAETALYPEKKATRHSRLKKTLQADLYRYRGATGWRAKLSAYLREPGFRFTYYLRKVAHYAPRRRSLGIFGYIYNRILLHHYRFRYGFDISPVTAIGPGLYIGHFGGVIISPFAVLGRNVN